MIRILLIVVQVENALQLVFINLVWCLKSFPDAFENGLV